MIIIKTKEGDTIEIQERELWGDNTNGDFCSLIMRMRLDGCLMLPRRYLPFDSVAFIVRTPEANVEAPFRPQ